jgi:hypothetical protein
MARLADEWNELADDVMGHPLEERIATAQVTWPNPSSKESDDTRWKTIAGASRLCEM